ncbi:MAG: aminopeptidase P family protein [Clostridia bacterium]|nr:aminopeptidase P family protein [Clostridia bacterium]
MEKMEKRYELLRREMGKIGVDAIYVSSAENHQYVTDFDNPDGWAFITMDKAWVYADPRYIEAARAEATSLCKVCLPGEPTIPSVCAEESIRTIGYEDFKLTCAELERLRKSFEGQDIRFVPLGGMLTSLREFKTDDEVASIVAAQRIAEAAFDHICKVLTYDMTEVEVAAELEYYMKKHGSQKPSFDTICVSGTASSRPHGVPRNVKLEKGFLTMDFGAMVNGYHSDMTRTVVIGKADSDMKRLYDTVLKAQLAAEAAVAEGKKNFDIDKIARDIIYSAGYEGKFGHGLGHGVGLEIHEEPRLSPKTGDEVLKAGQIVTVEPGIYIEGLYGCRIEDMMYVTETGADLLTDCPKELIEL